MQSRMSARTNRSSNGSRWRAFVLVAFIVGGALVLNYVAGERSADGGALSGNEAPRESPREGGSKISVGVKDSTTEDEEEAVEQEVSTQEEGVVDVKKPEVLAEDQEKGEQEKEEQEKEEQDVAGEDVQEQQGVGGKEEEMKPLEPPGAFHVKLGKQTIKSSPVMDFTSEALFPGHIWLPMGLHDVASGDPWVTLCLMNYGKYQADPSGAPMFTNLIALSKCGQGGTPAEKGVATGSSAVVRMSSLLKTMEETGLDPVPPRGFVYHETRCGSTLVANMLAAPSSNRVFSESKPPVQAIRTCKEEGCDAETLTKVFRGTIALMGRRRVGDEPHENLFFKFQNSKFVPEITKAFPEVPWVFVFRDPVEVMVSNLKSFAAGPCVRIPRQEKTKGKRPVLKRPGLGLGLGKSGGGANVSPKKSPKFGPVPKFKMNQPKGSGGARLLRHSADGEWSGEELDQDGARSGMEEGNDLDWEVVGMDWGVELEFDASHDSHAGEWSWEGEFWDGGVTPSAAGFLRGFGSRRDMGHGYRMTEGMNSTDEGSVAPDMGALSAHETMRGKRGLLGGPRKELTKPSLTKGMCEECAEWLQMLCDAAIKAGDDTPEIALFVDYNNLPDAVPEFVFPEHFRLREEMDKVEPTWKDTMYKVGGLYSKGGLRPTHGPFKGDVEATLPGKWSQELLDSLSKFPVLVYFFSHNRRGKVMAREREASATVPWRLEAAKHRSASPLIVETAEADGGLYEVYHKLEKLQAWSRPES